MVDTELLPIRNEALESAPNGMYYLISHIEGNTIEAIRDYYDVTIDEMRHAVKCRLTARIDDGEHLPSGVEHAEIRPDGKRLVCAWMPV